MNLLNIRLRCVVIIFSGIPETSYNIVDTWVYEYVRSNTGVLGLVLLLLSKQLTMKRDNNQHSVAIFSIAPPGWNSYIVYSPARSHAKCCQLSISST